MSWLSLSQYLLFPRFSNVWLKWTDLQLVKPLKSCCSWRYLSFLCYIKRDYHRNLKKKKKNLYVRGPGGLNCILCLESHKAELNSYQKSPEKYPPPCLLQFWEEFVFHLVLALCLFCLSKGEPPSGWVTYRKLSDFFCPKLARTLWF